MVTWTYHSTSHTYPLSIHSSPLLHCIFASSVSKMRPIFVGDCKKRQISRHELSASQERVTRENVSYVSALKYISMFLLFFHLGGSSLWWWIIRSKLLNMNQLKPHNVIFPFQDAFNVRHPFLPNIITALYSAWNLSSHSLCQHLIWWIVSQSLIHWPISD